MGVVEEESKRVDGDIFSGKKSIKHRTFQDLRDIRWLDPRIYRDE